MAVVGLNAVAHAQLVTWLGCNIPVPNNIDGVYINVETRQSGPTGASVAGWDINPYSATALTWFNAAGTGMMRYPGVTTGSAGNLADRPDWVVGPSGSFGSGTVIVGSAPGNWHLNSVNMFGFRFIASDGLTRYGMGTFEIGSAINGADRMITNIFYEASPGVPIMQCLTPQTYWRDLDLDGYGNPASGAMNLCWGAPAGWVSSLYGTEPIDCNDADPLIRPNTVWYRDLDGDGLGIAADGTIVACVPPSGFALHGGDNCAERANPGQEDLDGDLIGDACEVALADLDLDGAVGAKDLAILLAEWAGPNAARADITGDGVIDATDLAALLARWGPVAP